MRFRAVPLRAILLPLAVAIASISAVAWYGLVKIPAQQRYITDRNLRLLKTKSAQIKSKVDSFDLSIDHALDFFPRKKLNDKDYAEQFQEYVRLFAPGLQIIGKVESDTEKTIRRRAGDPPRVVIERDEGRNYLYLGYHHGDAILVAKGDIEQILKPFVATGTEFDALVLVTRDGRVIAQQSSSGLELVHVDALRDSSRPPPPASPSPSGQRAEQPGVFESLRTSTNIANVTLGNAEYQMYIQPVQLSLNAGVSKQWPMSSDAMKPPDGDVPEEWALCGFVRADHFRAASSLVSYTYLLWFGVALVTVCLAIPLLKLHILSPSERLRSTDGVLVAATTFLATTLLTFCAVDAYYIRSVFNGVTSHTLEGVASELRDHFNDETYAIAAQLKAFQQPPTWAGFENDRGLSAYRSKLTAVTSHELPTTIRERDKRGDRFTCNDRLACRDQILAYGLPASYPFFDLIVFDDEDGWQRIKWSTGGVTPFLNLKETQLPYYPQLKSARLLLESGSGATPHGGISVIQSPNTGDTSAVFWTALEPKSDTGRARSTDLIGQSLSTDLISLVDPVLPGHVRFAVIDHTGRVMFHSDPTRRLQENFFLECEDNPELRSAVSSRGPTSLTASYLGRRYRMNVMPLDLSGENLQTFDDPGWTLVVFQDMSVAETLNVETLTVAVRMFGLYAAGLAAAWALLHLIGRRRVTKWFWPDQSAGRGYRATALVNGLLGVLFLGWIAHFESTALVAATGLLVSGALLSTVLLITRFRTPDADDQNWLAAFHAARVSFLFIVAAVPAIACFQAAYDFESTLLARSAQIAVAAQLDAREDRINSRAQRLTLCHEGDSAKDCNRAAASFIDVRTNAGVGDIPWDIDVSSIVWRDREATSKIPAALTRLDVMLAGMHGAYNDLGAEMAAVLPRRASEDSASHRWRHWIETGNRIELLLAKARSDALTETLRSSVATAVPAAGLWLIVAGLIGALYVLMRVVVQPLYALELQAQPRVKVSDPSLDSSRHVLLVGPPGSGKSLRLRNEANIRVFDARIRAFFERRVVARPVPIERRRSVAAAVSAIRSLAWTDPVEAAPSLELVTESSPRVDWLDASNLPTDRSVPIGVDHLEYSLDNRTDRERMLQFLEELIYRHSRTVWIAAAREPITQLRELSADRPDTGEMARWIRVFQSFREEHFGLASDEPPLGDGDAEQRLNVAAPYYGALWSACSKDEQLVLRQLADEGVVNPRNPVIVAQLLRSGLIRRDPTFRLMNEAFQRFVVQALSADEIAARERTGVSLPWASVTTAMLTVALGLSALLILTSRQLVDDWIGYVPALAPAVPTVFRLLTGVRRDDRAAMA